MMISLNSYPTVSDGLAAMIRAFEKNRTTGIVMVRKDVAVFLEGLQALHDAARITETIADRVQWNEKARRDVLEAAMADGSVTILPVVARSTAHRHGGPEGGAA